MSDKPTSKYVFETSQDSLTSEMVDSIHQRLLKRLATQAVKEKPDNSEQNIMENFAAPFSRSAFSRSNPS